MEQQHWTQAEQHYQKALQFLIALDNHPGQAVTYHQLGIAAQEQRRWVQAQSYYQQALEIKIEFHNRHSQANTYHQLGCVALELGQWTQARDCFLEALNVAVDFDDEYIIDARLHNLAIVWQSSGDADLPAAVADILSVMPRQAKILLTDSLAGE